MSAEQQIQELRTQIIISEADYRKASLYDKNLSEIKALQLTIRELKETAMILLQNILS